MAKRGEVSLRAGERMKGFDENMFAGGDRIVYKHEGHWQMGELDAVDTPVRLKDNKKIIASLIGGEISLNVPPVKVEFSVRDAVPGTVYEVQTVKPGPDGEVWYDLVNTTTNKVEHNVDQEMLLHSRDISNLESRFITESQRLIGEIRRVSAERGARLLDDLVNIAKKVVEARVKLEKVEDNWSRANVAELSGLEHKAEDLRRQLEEDIRDLERNIQDLIDQEDIQEPRAQVALAFEQRSTDNLRLADEREQDRFKAEEERWKRRDERHKEWAERLERLQKESAEARVVARGQKATQSERDLAVELGTRVRELENQEPNKPGELPKLEKPSDSEEDKRDLVFETFKDLEDHPTPEMKPLIDAVLERRRAKASRAGVGADYPPGNPARKDRSFLLYRQVTVEVLKDVLEEWKKLPSGKKLETAEELDKQFEEEREKLKEKIQKLRERARKLNKTPNRETILTALDATDGRVIALKRQTTSNDDLLNFWRDLSSVQIDIIREEQRAGTADREVEASFVDLPQGVVKEMLTGDPIRIEAAMRAAFSAAIEEGSTNEVVRQHLEDFIDHFQPSANFKHKLARYGIKDWEAFKDQWRRDLAGKFAMVLIEMADSELRNMVVQTVEDIRQGGGVLSNLLAEARFSALANMKGAMALRLLVNSGVLAAAGVGTDVLLTLLRVPGAARAGLVGGAVGAVKVGLQRLMGKDEGYFQEAAKRAQKDAERNKKQFIRDQLLGRIFDAGHNLRANRETEMALLFSTAMRTVTRKEVKGAQSIDIADPDHPGVKVTLEGDAVCIYYEALKRAAEDEGVDIEEEEKTKFAFAKALHALRNNKLVNLQELPPMAARTTQWLMDTYSGRIAVQPGAKKAEVLIGVQPEVPAERVGSGRQALGTIALGATIGEAMVLQSGAVGAGIGAAAGVAIGERSGYKKERSQADREARRFLEELSSNFNTRLRPLTQNAGETPDQFFQREMAHSRQLVQLDAVLAALLQGRSLEDLPVADLPPDEANTLTSRNRDLASLAQRDQKLRTLLEGMRREIARSRELDRIKFEDRLTKLKNNGDRLAENADKKVQNSLFERVKRGAKRHVRAAIYGAIGGTVSYFARYGIRAAWHGVMGDQNLMQKFFVRDASAATSGADKTTEAVAGAGRAAEAGAVAAGAAKASGAGSPDTTPSAGSTSPDGKSATEVGPPPGSVEYAQEHQIVTPHEITPGQGPYHAFEKLWKELQAVTDNQRPAELRGMDRAGFYKWGEQQLAANHGFRFEGNRIGFPVTLQPGAKLDLFVENGHAKLQFEDHHLTHHKNYLWETPGKGLEKGGPVDRGPAVEPTGSTEPVARGAHDYLQERQVYVQELKSGGAWPLNELEGKHDPLHNFGIKIKVGEGNLTRADADLVRDAIMDLQGKYKLASNEYFRAGDANDHVAQDHAATQMVDAFAAAEQLKGILHSGRIGDLANFRDSLSSVVAKPAGGGAGEAAVAVQTGVRGFDSSSLVGRGGGGGEGERFHFGPEKVDPRFNHSGLKSAAEIEKEVAPNESAGAADKELAASQGTAGAKEAAVASPAEVQAKMQADLALVEENMPILRLKFLDVQDAISDRIGEVKSVNQSALDLSRQITSAMDKLLTGNIPGDELYKLAPLVQIDTTHASPSEIFNSVKDLFPSEAQAYFNHSTANIMSESGAVYSVVVADHPSHAITLIDSGGNAFTYIDNNNTFTTDSEGVVVVVAPGGAHFNGVVNYFQGNNFPMVIKGEPVGLVDSMQPEEVALAAKEKAGISSEPVARGNRQGGSRGETARAVAADTSSKGMGAGLERQLEGARTLIETGSFTTAQQRVLENVQFMLHNRETTWSADGSGLRALAEQVPNISTFLNDPQYSGQVDSWLQGLLKEHHSLVDKFVSNLQSGSDFNKIMGPVSAHLLGFEDLPNVHLDTSDPASLSAFRRSELESLRVRFATTLERSLQQAVQDKSIREANSWMGDKSPSNGGQI